MNRKIATALLALGTVVGFGSGIASLGCGAHRDRGRFAAACERAKMKESAKAPAATEPSAPSSSTAPAASAPDAPVPSEEAPPQ